MTHRPHLLRRHVLLLPFLLAACGGGESEPDPVFEPLGYNGGPPIQLNVATIEIEQRFVPAGVPPDVTAQDPVPPVEALKIMAGDRLKAFGTSGRAVFAILDGSLSKNNDEVKAVMRVSLTIYGADDAQAGFAEARVEQQHTGHIDNLHSLLYDMTKSMLVDMNVELEYQIRHNLRDWLVTTDAPATPVEQAPLEQTPADQTPADQTPAD